MPGWGSPHERRASGHPPPSLHRLRTIAVSLLRGRAPRRLLLGLELEDLVAAGWLGYVTTGDERTGSYPYRRARWAMLDEMRRWYGVQRTADGWIRFRAESLTESLTEASARDDARDDARLSAEQTEDLRAFCARHLHPRLAELVLGLLVDGESLELLAERQGRTLQAARVARSHAITKLRRALAA